LKLTKKQWVQGLLAVLAALSVAVVIQYVTAQSESGWTRAKVGLLIIPLFGLYLVIGAIFGWEVLLGNGGSLKTGTNLVAKYTAILLGIAVIIVSLVSYR
jgi:chromate transport protein ChrA